MLDLETMINKHAQGIKNTYGITEVEMDVLIAFATRKSQELLQVAVDKKASTEGMLTNIFLSGVALGSELKIENQEVRGR